MKAATPMSLSVLSGWSKRSVSAPRLLFGPGLAFLGRQRQRLPAGNGPGTVAGLIVVPNAWEQPAQLEGGREFASLIEGGADRGDLCIGDDEHRSSMAASNYRGKRNFQPRRWLTAEAIIDITPRQPHERRAARGHFPFPLSKPSTTGGSGNLIKNRPGAERQDRLSTALGSDRTSPMFLTGLSRGGDARDRAVWVGSVSHRYLLSAIITLPAMTSGIPFTNSRTLSLIHSAAMSLEASASSALSNTRMLMRVSCPPSSK
jgi:hypothetical protein